jgi:hypothetical protein
VAQKPDRRARVQKNAIFEKKMGGLTAAMADHFELVLDMMLTVRLLAAVVRLFDDALEPYRLGSDIVSTFPSHHQPRPRQTLMHSRSSWNGR